jgi:tetraacyldisaccharide 4'-kinase
MREPAFWRRKAGIAAKVLSPLAAAYGGIAGGRLHRPGARAQVPVICIGNPTAGGSGKTPTAIAVVHRLAAAGENPMLLTRGYGGQLAGPVWVDASRHSAQQVGDEPLRLVRAARTVVSRDRVAGAKAAAAAGATVIVMDDGFQNPSLHKDLSILTVDARRGIGNGHVLPAGPLRAPLDLQLTLAQAMIVMGEDHGADDVAERARLRGLQIFRAHLVPDREVIANLEARAVLAYAGIGDPSKFFATLAAAKVQIAATHAFADHHRYTAADARALLGRATTERLVLVSTEKDVARLQHNPVLAELAARTIALPVTVVLDGGAAFGTFLMERLAAARLARA